MTVSQWYSPFRLFQPDDEEDTLQGKFSLGREHDSIAYDGRTRLRRRGERILLSAQNSSPVFGSRAPIATTTFLSVMQVATVSKMVVLNRAVPSGQHSCLASLSFELFGESEIGSG